MSRLFTRSNNNALFEALAMANAARLAGFRKVTCRFLGNGVFQVEAE